MSSMEYMFKNVTLDFSALKKPFTGKFGTTYSVALSFDPTTADSETMEILKTLASTLTKGGPVDLKAEDKFTKTGRLGLSFNSPTPIQVVDAKGRRLAQEEIPMIGKGSIANVKFRVAQTSHGTFKYISGVQLVSVEEVSVTQKEVVFDAVDGFTVDEPVEADFESMFK